MLLPGDTVEVLPAAQIVATLDGEQALEHLPFMPEMLPYCGRTFRVGMRAERTCVHPPEFPLRRLESAVVLEGLRCDGSAHGGCQLGCMIYWKESWLRRVRAGDMCEPRAGSAPQPMDLRASRDGDPATFFCQGTELRRATLPGDAFWSPGQYLRMLRVHTFTLAELVGVFARPGMRRLRRLVGRRALHRPAAGRAPDGALNLQPGDRVRIKSSEGIAATLDARGTHRGLAFGGDMREQCGRTGTVLRRVDRIVDEGSGRVRTVHDTVLLEGSTCDRYFGCARGMPFLWREAWLKRVAPEAAANPAAGQPSGAPAAARTRASERQALAAKRAFDVVGAAAALVALSPVLAGAALALWATQGRPILFRHVRPGLGGRSFTLLKFRTMRPPRPDEVFYLTDEQRLTRLGRLLRSTSIDELPELWNVLRGDMSLVGPRPLLTEYLATYTDEQRRRHDMRPGITGWAAVNGRHALRFEERLRLDVWYVDHWSLALDLRIIAMTLGQVLRRRDTVAAQDLAQVGFPLPGVTQMEDREPGAGGQADVEARIAGVVAGKGGGRR